MRRRIVLTVLLCLATALAIGAAPALAASGCTCHTADPPTAPAAHAPLVLGVTDCTTCHKGWAVPHPELVVPSLTLMKDESALLRGRFVVKGKGINGVVVYLQQRLWGKTAFTDLGQVTTQRPPMAERSGWFLFPVPSRTPWAAYRAVSEGVAGPPVVVPGKRVWRPTPRLTLKLSNVVNGWVPPLGAPTFKGRARPLKLAGEKVSLPVYKFRAATQRWVKVKTATASISATGSYAWTYWWSQGFGRGSYRVRASIAGTADHTLVTTTWRYFKDK